MGLSPLHCGPVSKRRQRRGRKLLSNPSGWAWVPPGPLEQVSETTGPHSTSCGGSRQRLVPWSGPKKRAGPDFGERLNKWFL